MSEGGAQRVMKGWGRGSEAINKVLLCPPAPSSWSSRETCAEGEGCSRAQTGRAVKSAEGGGYPGAGNSRGWRKISSAREGRGGPRLQLEQEEPEAFGLQECVGVCRLECVGAEWPRGSGRRWGWTGKGLWLCETRGESQACWVELSAPSTRSP